MEMMKLERIVTEVVLGDSRKHGDIIKFATIENLKMDDYLIMNIEEKEYHFQISEISTSIGSSKLRITATDVGYYNRIKRIDIRKLIGCEVELVTNNDKISRMAKESCYC